MASSILNSRGIIVDRNLGVVCSSLCTKCIPKCLPQQQNKIQRYFIGDSDTHTYFVIATIPSIDTASLVFTNSVSQLTSIEKRICKFQAAIDQLAATNSLDNQSVEQLLKYARERDEAFVDSSIIVPLMREQILLYDMLPKPSSEEDISLAQAIREMLLNMMALHDVEPYQISTNQFDPQQQRCVGYMPTCNPSLDKQIAERVRTGFKRSDKILRYEEVRVYRFESQQS